MKRIFAVLISLLLVFSLAACAGTAGQNTTPENGGAPVQEPASGGTKPQEEKTESSPASGNEASSASGGEGTSADNTKDESQAESGEPAQPQEEEVTIRLAAMTGPTGMGMAKLLADNDAGTSANKYEFTLAGGADEITPLLVKGDLDIAAVPLNLASVLYNNTKGGVKLMAVNTLGVLYIVDNDGSVQSLEDLKGRTIYATGKGATPDYTLRYLLTQNGIDPDADLTIEFKSEPAEILAVFKNADSSVVAMLPQPFVTSAQMNVEGLHVALDLTAEWEKLENGSGLFTGCVIVRTEFAEAHPQAVANFLADYSASIEFVNSNPSDAAAMIETYGIVAKAPIALKAIPYCNIVFFTDFDAVKGYLQVLFDQNPKAVGGAMPGEDFYYGN